MSGDPGEDLAREVSEWLRQVSDGLGRPDFLDLLEEQLVLHQQQLAWIADKTEALTELVRRGRALGRRPVRPEDVTQGADALEQATIDALMRRATSTAPPPVADPENDTTQAEGGDPA